ncbi:uncharacterized protein LOC129613073 [Condylostylus longicornis]|uniref:uncharacterized protein LOC129613073 n=1 Tax=Condylostylus longicornis TaxID=2530218 RepID=UPI00244E2917|nr:uncharacterized protein LOC129613073 [Condylostylus longicornis]
MNILFIILFLTIGFNESNGKHIVPDIFPLDMAPKGPLEDKFLNMIKEFTDRMCHEITRLNIPRLDPFNLEFFDIDFIPNFEIKLEDIEVSRLSYLEIPKLKINMAFQKIDAKIQLDNLQLMSNYKLKGKIPGLMDIDGEGKLSVDIGVTIEVLVQLKTSIDKKLSIKILKLEPKLIVNKFRITGLFEDEELNQFFEDMIQDLASEIFDDFWTENEQMIIELLEPFLSAPFDDLTPMELLALLTSGEPIFNETDPPPNCKESSVFLENIQKVRKV